MFHCYMPWWTSEDLTDRVILGILALEIQSSEPSCAVNLNVRSLRRSKSAFPYTATATMNPVSVGTRRWKGFLLSLASGLIPTTLATGCHDSTGKTHAKIIRDPFNNCTINIDVQVRTEKCNQPIPHSLVPTHPLLHCPHAKTLRAAG